MNPALFAVDTWKISDRVAVDLEFCQNFNSQFGNYLNPSLGSRWEITPNLALHAAVAGAQRNPGLDQLYLYDTVHGWFPNQDLDRFKIAFNSCPTGARLSSVQMVNNNEATASKTRSRNYLPAFFCNIEIDKPKDRVV